MSDEGRKPVQNRPAVSVDVLRKVAKDSASAVMNMQKDRASKPYVAPKERVSAQDQLRTKNLVAAGGGIDPKRIYGADGKVAGKPWDRVEEIKTIAACLMEYPPAHPERKRAEIARKIEEIHRLAEELLQDMPKTKSRQGAVGLD